MDWIQDQMPVYKIPVRRVKQGSHSDTSSNASDEPKKTEKTAKSAHTNSTKQPTPTKQVQTTVSLVDEDVETPTAEASNWQKMALRLQADMDNFKKRQSKRADEAIVREQERLLNSFLPIADNLKRALSYETENKQALQEGVELVYRQLITAFAKEGVVQLKTVGEVFNPDYHEAVATIPTEAESGTIVEEVEAGYRFNAKLLRPARVIVAE